MTGKCDIGEFGQQQHGGLVGLHPFPQIIGIGLRHLSALATVLGWIRWSKAAFRSMSADSPGWSIRPCPVAGMPNQPHSGGRASKNVFKK